MYRPPSTVFFLNFFNCITKKRDEGSPGAQSYGLHEVKFASLLRINDFNTVKRQWTSPNRFGAMKAGRGRGAIASRQCHRGRVAGAGRARGAGLCLRRRAGRSLRRGAAGGGSRGWCAGSAASEPRAPRDGPPARAGTGCPPPEGPH